MKNSLPKATIERMKPHYFFLLNRRNSIAEMRFNNKNRELNLHNKFYVRVFLLLMEVLKEFYNFLKYFNGINYEKGC